MEITEVRVKLSDRQDDRLKAYCTVTFDGLFVIREVRVVEGGSGVFVAMPSRKTSIPCPRCSHRNQVHARFCNDCGAKLPPAPQPVEGAPRTKQHRDIAHPITPEFRETLQLRVLEAFRIECERAQLPGYEPNSMDSEESAVEAPVARFVEPAVSEYDALIADLRRGGGPRQDPVVSTSHKPAVPRSVGARESERPAPRPPQSPRQPSAAPRDGADQHRDSAPPASRKPAPARSSDREQRQDRPERVEQPNRATRSNRPNLPESPVHGEGVEPSRDAAWADAPFGTMREVETPAIRAAAPQAPRDTRPPPIVRESPPPVERESPPPAKRASAPPPESAVETDEPFGSGIL